MAINWYPGHMHKARKDILKCLHSMDVLIEIVDARAPFSSQNPLIAEWRKDLPSIVILSKTDLSDDELTEVWRQHLERNDHIKTLSYEKGKSQIKKAIIELCKKLVPQKVTSFEAINAMVVGIPNVGKSTIINALANKAIAKVGDEPAVTKRQQKVYLDNQVTLHDTPGLLWPKIENPNSGYRLAIMGSIKNTAIEFDDIAFFAAEYLLDAYPDRLQQRYQLSQLPDSALSCLETIGRQRGALGAGGRIDLHKAAEALIHDLRHGQLGKISFEKPQQVEQELIELEEEKQRKADLKARAKKTKRTE